MKTSHVGAVLLMFLGSPALPAAEPATPAGPPAAVVRAGAIPRNLRTAADFSMRKGAAFLTGKQLPDGSWLQHPAIAALACIALVQSPAATQEPVRAAVNRGLDFVVNHAQPDGSIWNKDTKEYPNYSTAISTIALTVANRPQDTKIVRAARDFLLNSQFQDVASTDPSYGGIGYAKALKPDLSNTQWALEALYLTDHLDREPISQNPAAAAKSDLAWERARQFLTRCQNLKGSNDQTWVAADPENRGGFVYMPGESKAGENEDGDSLRSYGSMTYAGLKSMIYARVQRDDPRVKAAIDWLRRNYTFDENPQMGQQGYYYYVHTLAKALAAYGDDIVTDRNGKTHSWRADLLETAIGLQREGGEWQNDNARWMESLPELTTCYTLIAMEIACGQPTTPAIPSPTKP